MKGFFPISGEDLILVRKPVLALFCIVLVCVGAYAAARFFSDAQHRAMQAAAAHRQQAESLYRNAVQEARTIRAYLDRYRQLADQGIIGDEDRLSLIEHLASVRERYRLFPVEVDISPQVAAATIPFGEGGRVLTLNASAVQLRLNLLHEEDLFRLLASLREVRGLVVAEACELSRSHPGPGGRPPEMAENLAGSLRFFWVTLERQEP